MSENSSQARVIVEGSARVLDGDRERYIELVKGVVDASAKRPGCLKFAVAEDIADRNLFHLTELWADMASLDASRFGDENRRMLQDLASLDIRDRQVLIHHVSHAEPG